MWSVILSVALSGVGGDSVWTIASDGSLVELRLTVPIEAVEPESEHTAKPTVKPVTLNHSYRTTRHERGCEMCLGQHLRNMHGKTYNGLDKVGYWNWVRYHEKLHDEGVVSKSAKQSTSTTYTTPQRTRQRRGLICRLRGG